MRPMTVSYWPLLKCSKHGGTTLKAASMKFLCLQTTTTSNASWIWKAWALGKSVRLKNCQVECWGRRNLPSQEYKDPTPTTVLIGSNVEIERFENERSGDEVTGAVSPTPSPHLWDNCPFAVVLIVGHPSKRASCQKPLYYQYWRHKNEASWALG